MIVVQKGRVMHTFLPHPHILQHTSYPTLNTPWKSTHYIIISSLSRASLSASSCACACTSLSASSLYRASLSASFCACAYANGGDGGVMVMEVKTRVEVMEVKWWVEVTDVKW